MIEISPAGVYAGDFVGARILIEREVLADERLFDAHVPRLAPSLELSRSVMAGLPKPEFEERFLQQLQTAECGQYIANIAGIALKTSVLLITADLLPEYRHGHIVAREIQRRFPETALLRGTAGR